MISDSSREEEDGLIKFVYQMEEDFSERIITVHFDEDGMIIFSIFDTDQWSMISDICELSGANVQDVVRDISEDNNIATIIVDPKEIP